MTKYRICISLLVLAISCHLCLAQANDESEPRWRRDWQAFGQAVAVYSRRGDMESPTRHRSLAEFNRTFGATVRWIGRVREVNEYRVKLDMETISIPARDGTLLPLSGLTIDCAARRCADWTAVAPGSRVEFRTTLENRTRGLRPLVEIIGRGDNRRVLIQAWEAELARALPEQ